MSGSENSQRTPIGQVKNPIVDQNSHSELIRLQCEYYRKLNALLSDESVEVLKRRVASLVQGAFLPSTGFGDVSTLAGLLNLDARSIERHVKESGHPQMGFGRTNLYSFAAWLVRKTGKKVAAK